MKINNLMPDPEILKELGGRLARVRKQQRFSQAELAQEAGIGVATLRRIEGGQDSQFATWLKLMKTLDKLSAIEALLPEKIKSPRAEAGAKEAGAKRRRRKQSAAPATSQSDNDPDDTLTPRTILWGDEKT